MIKSLVLFLFCLFKDNKLRELESLKSDVAETERSIEATEPIVREAVRRTNDSFVRVEDETERAHVEVQLMRDLAEGWEGRRPYG